MSVVDQHGRAWSELDALRAHMGAREVAKGSYIVVSEDGAPLCGRVVDSSRVRVAFVARGWRSGTTADN